YRFPRLHAIPNLHGLRAGSSWTAGLPAFRIASWPISSAASKRSVLGEMNRVRFEAVFAVLDPGCVLTQPYRGAADAPIFGREGFPDRLAPDECRQIRCRRRGPCGGR